jgi:nucleoside-diphosphate-sugar epimerase
MPPGRSPPSANAFYFGGNNMLHNVRVMLVGFLRRKWDEVAYIPMRDALPRVLADLLSVNFSFLGAFALWYAFRVLVLGELHPPLLALFLAGSAAFNTLFWSPIAIAIFHLSGFYTRTRGYQHRYKALVILRAISLLVVVFVFGRYLYHGALVAPGVAVLAWLLLVITVGGSRLVKDSFLRHYRVEPVHSPKKPRTVLVVGGAGYLGSVMVPKLLERGYHVRVFDSFLYGREPLADSERHPNCTLVSGDVRQIEGVVQAVRGCDAIIHLAAIVGDPACEENRALAIEVNRAATRVLIDVARGHGVERFVFASTCSVYGASEFLVDEQTQPEPLSVYAHTKVDSEGLLLGARSGNFHPTILRLGTLFGGSPRLRLDLVVNLLTARAARTGKITIFNQDQWRPFVHVHDAARAFVAMLDAPVSLVSGEIFNIGSYDSNHHLADLAKIISRVVPTVEVEHVENEDKRNYRAAFDKVHTRLGFVCERTLEDGIREVFKAVSAHGIEDIACEQFNNRARMKSYALTAGATHSSIRLLEALARAE